MKCLALGWSTASLILLIASSSFAQDAKHPSTDSAVLNPAPTIAAAPEGITPPNPTSDFPAKQVVSGAQRTIAQYGPPNPYGELTLPPPVPPLKDMVYRGGPVPYGYKVEEKYNLGLILGGSALFAIAYGITAWAVHDKPGTQAGSGYPDNSPWNALYVPIGGPFAFAANAPGKSGFIYVSEGLAQIAGVSLVLVALFTPKKMLVHKDVATAYSPSLQIGPRALQLEMRF